MNNLFTQKVIKMGKSFYFKKGSFKKYFVKWRLQT